MTLIKLDGVGIKFALMKRQARKLRSNPLALLRKKSLIKSSFWALKNITFDLSEGDSLGLIGHNGAGKSTLCSVMSGILMPDKGSVDINAHVAPILTLGAGFNKELSGIDNIRLCGALMGIDRTTLRIVEDDIIAFAELEDFIENPINTYSSGMRARLAFGLATSVRPDVLIVDEALSVGDKHFREKAAARMTELRGQAKATVVVSHSMASLRSMCNRGLLLDRGRIVAEGPIDEIVDQYEGAEDQRPGQRVDDDE